MKSGDKCEYGTIVKFRPPTTGLQEPTKRKTANEPLTATIEVMTSFVIRTSSPSTC